PSICLLVGVGLAEVMSWLGRFAVAPERAALAAFSILAVLGIAGLLRDVIKPYKTEGDEQVRHVLFDIVRQAGPDDQIVVMDPTASIAPSVEWYLRRQGARISWNGVINWEGLSAKPAELWNLYFSQDRLRPGRLAAEYSQNSQHRLALMGHEEHWMQMGWEWDESTRRYCDFYHWHSAATE